MSDPRVDFLASALCNDSDLTPNASFPTWFGDRARRHRFAIEQIPFNQLEKWGFDADTGRLCHESGKFFSVYGLRVWQQQHRRSERCWDQPILHQPEVGILGFVTKKFDGVLHFLVQAKMEPGNINFIQISPTVQATRSNYTRIHEGRTPHYLEYFLDQSRARVLVDSFQSEQGTRFFRKRNRNVVVETEEDVPLLEDYCWLTLGQMYRLLRRDNVINMDARTVLSCIPMDAVGFAARDSSKAIVTEIEHACRLEPGRLQTTRSSLESALLRTLVQPVDTQNYTADLQWLTQRRFVTEQHVEFIPLRGMRDWCVEPARIAHRDKRFFEVIGVRVEAGNREVAGWCQPIIKPTSVGLMAYIVRVRQRKVDVLVQAKCEPGNADVVEIGPTVQCFVADIEPGSEPAFLAEVEDATFGSVCVDTLQSEEGGRFYQEGNRNRVVVVDDEVADDPPPGYRWISLNHLRYMVHHPNLLNVEARCLLASLGMGAVQESIQPVEGRECPDYA